MDKREMLAEAIAEAKQLKEVAYSQAKITMEENLMPHLQSMLSKRIQEMETEDDEVEESFIPEEEVNEEAEVADNDLDELLREIENDDEETPEPEQEEGDEIPDDEDEELNIEDMSEEDLKGFIEDVMNDMIEAGELEPGEEYEKEDEESEEEIDVDAIEGDEKPDEDEEIKEDLEEESVEDDEDYLAEIASFKTQLSEMKVFNAKLLYTNKIFLSKTLTEGKKIQVLHAFEKAGTVKEAKMIYETLKDNLGDKKIVRESFKGAASKTITPIKESKQPIIEVDNQYKRWKFLAGITTT